VLLPLLAAALASAAAASSAAETSPRASASAFGVLVETAGGSASGSGAAAAPPRASSALGGYEYPAGGGIVSTGPVQADAGTGPGSAARGEASAVVRGVRLFGGEVTVDAVALEARAQASRDGASGDLSGSRVSGLVVEGEAVDAFPNARVPLGDWGYAVVLEQAVQRGDAQEAAYRGFVTGLHVVLTADHGGLPAGSEILVGYAEAAARWPLPPPEQEAGGGNAGAGQGETGGKGSGGTSGQGAKGGKGGDSGALPQEPGPRPPGAPTGGIPDVIRNPPASVRPEVTGNGYVFPVYGSASFSDDFGYPRADTGWHHGNDIFAPLGSPVLAVADGTVFSVGWNDLGGWRLWLRDARGNEYYYAHLSAYSPLAVDGTSVKAGDVLGFVGDTGDARGTPYHLHFEFHPSALLGLGYDGVIDPYPYLVRWRQARDLALDVTSAPARTGATQAPEAAATLLTTDDVSTASGLVPGALEQALALPLLGQGGEGSLVPAVRPLLVGAAPGFDAVR
jgi:murein DD-endopeptidase MepM/ murein hydrolase activator NlpD